MTFPKYPLFLFCVFVSAHCFSQVVGKVTDSTGKPLPYVNIYLKNTAVGTTTNKNGNYELALDELGEHIVVFQYLGYKTEQKEIEIQTFPFTLNVSLTEESTSLAPVILSNGENPAIRIIEKAIEHRKENQAKLQKFTADFYSRGLWRVQNVPEKFMGAEIGDLGGGLDSTRSGVVYLSETISKIAYQAPDNFKEKIIASKVSGDDNGFSFNSAREFNISFYNNTLEINAEIVSPIADYAFNYYNYKLEGTFYDEHGNLINKIQVIPKRPDDAVFSGHIYIVEDSWEIYGVDLSTTGEAVQVPIIEKLGFQQNFKYSKTENRWVLRS
ncbi:MAG TPA: DUF5686 family protein, partial [Flavobacteriaceae bacterium]|nr:DUF5686 family protein [Flavobacteriaceae bacterium]